jgi:predicted nucleic acid-binding protein
MTGAIFVDSNILIYAHDLDAGAKHLRAAACLRELWDAGSGRMSTQVLQEFCVNLTRKIPGPLAFGFTSRPFLFRSGVAVLVEWLSPSTVRQNRGSSVSLPLARRPL